MYFPLVIHFSSSAQMKVIVNTSWRGPVKKLLQPYGNTGNGGPKYQKALTPNQQLIDEIFSKPSMPSHFRVSTYLQHFSLS